MATLKAMTTLSGSGFAPYVTALVEPSTAQLRSAVEELQQALDPTFSGILLGPQSLIIGNGPLLTGAGAQPTATVTRTTPGVSAIGTAVAGPRKVCIAT